MKNRYQNPWKLLFLSVICVAFLLCGCGKEADIESETIEILEGNKVKCTFVEPFDTSLYDLNELEQMINEEVDTFNNQKGLTCITVEAASVKEIASGEVAFVEMVFNDYKIFNEFNDRALFVGSVVQAQIAGYDLVNSLLDDKGTLISQDALDKIQDKIVVVVDVPVDVKVPNKIMYIAGEHENNSSKSVAFQESEQGLKAVLYK